MGEGSINWSQARWSRALLRHEVAGALHNQLRPRSGAVISPTDRAPYRVRTCGFIAQRLVQLFVLVNCILHRVHLLYRGSVALLVANASVERIEELNSPWDDNHYSCSTLGSRNVLTGVSAVDNIWESPVKLVLEPPASAAPWVHSICIACACISIGY